jgi:phage repressor protein C with HTH and peptisase S24 domain
MTTAKDIRLANLKRLKQEVGTLAALAREADTSAAHLGQILNGVRGMGDALARKIEANFGRPVGWMDQMSEEMRAATEKEIDELLAMGGGKASRYADYTADMYLIPKVRLRLSAGVTGFQTEPEPDDGSKVGVPKDWADRNAYRPHNLIALSIKGESMEPSLYAGDQVIVNTADTRMEDGAVYAFNYEGEAVIKRLRRDMGQWLLASDNPDQRRFHPKNCRDGECIIIGRVVRRETTHI